jgi:hypothetical protein
MANQSDVSKPTEDVKIAGNDAGFANTDTTAISKKDN